MQTRRRLPIAKLPYYMRSTITLARWLQPGTRLAGLSRRQPLSFRNGVVLEVPELLELLLAKETICEDVYGLADLTDADPRLIVDVGAGIGDFAVLAASSFPAARVLALEPIPRSFAALERNLGRNGLTNVEAHCTAVGTRPEYALHRARWSAQASAVSADGALVVPAMPLDRLIAGRQVDLLKIDCEGAELEVLDSAGDSLDLVARLVVEYHDHLIAGAGDRVEELLRAAGLGVRRSPDRYNRSIGYVHARRL
jgi:FkbM family methyltransferase